VSLVVLPKTKFSQCIYLGITTYMIGIALEWILHSRKIRKYNTKSWPFTCRISNFGDNHISTYSLYIALNWRLLGVFSFLFTNIMILLNTLKLEINAQKQLCNKYKTRNCFQYWKLWKLMFIIEVWVLLVVGGMSYITPKWPNNIHRLFSYHTKVPQYLELIIFSHRNRLMTKPILHCTCY